MSYKLSKKERKRRKLDKLVKHFETAGAKKQYAIQRMDLLIIAICTSGIILDGQAWMYIKSDLIRLDTPNIQFLVFFAAIAFALGIVINFFSQITGLECNDGEQSWANYEIKKFVGTYQSDMRCDQEAADKKSTSYHRYTTKLNRWSIALMLIGALLSMVLMGVMILS